MSCCNEPKKRRKIRLDKDSHIVIIGSGLGGLGAAISLEQAGFTNVVIYERDASASSRREGYGLTLTYNPKGPLAQMNLLEEVAQRDCPSRSHYIFAPDGSIVGYYGNAFVPNRGKGQRGNLRVPRQVLRQLLLDQVKSPVHWSKRLVSFDCGGEKVGLHFEDGSPVPNVDFLVGADGIRSSVLQTLLKNNNSNCNELRYLGVMIVLGIADFSHPLLDERGFYTLDGTHRLFTMPYEGSQISHSTKRRIMWQLSYRLSDEAEAKRLSVAGPEALRNEVLRRCRDWHEPVADMIESTPLSTIWGTALMDCDPEELLKQLDLQDKCRRVVVLGDAVHPMSPFKGQGANQALSDGPLLASWLQKANVDSAGPCFWREMIRRTAPKVQASREAAVLLHSPKVLSQPLDFAGVQPDRIAELLAELKQRKIGASTGSSLDALVQDMIHELDCGIGVKKENACHVQSQRALQLAAQGDTNELRNLSLLHAEAVRLARDDQGRSCLHLAAMGGHYTTCQWLLTEADVSPRALDKDGNNPIQLAIAQDQTKVVALLSAQLTNENGNCESR